VLYGGPIAEFIRLLILQPTPFCNINCDYCYLPERDSTARLTPETFRQVLTRVFDSGLVKGQLSVVWHAGEPLALPISYYSELFRSLPVPKSMLRHSIQTNAIPINDAWCDFIRENDINIGVSIDGPKFLHDSHRKDRQGCGTYDRVMRGIERLRTHRIDFHVIAVVTAAALDYADQIFDFFTRLRVERVGFNVEELEGDHRMSSLMAEHAIHRMRRFWVRLYERYRQSDGRMRIREFDRAYARIMHGPTDASAERSMLENSEAIPLGIISVNWQGQISSFSPELLGIKSVDYGDFAFGNIRDLSLPELRNDSKFARVAADIYEGVRNCERVCQYFSLCGGGAPSNKYFENGSFKSTETMYCRTSIQMPIDVVLQDIEGRLGLLSRQLR
jgi:uncharacterized protein